MSKHTPGPWTNREHSTFVHSKHGNICVCGDPRISKVVGYNEAKIGSPALDEAVANARRIVRAVNAHDDLLAALKGVIAVSDRATVEYDRARAAIAKAEA